MEREGGEGGAGCGRRVNSWRSHNQSASNLVVILHPHHDSHPSSLLPLPPLPPSAPTPPKPSSCPPANDEEGDESLGEPPPQRLDSGLVMCRWLLGLRWGGGHVAMCCSTCPVGQGGARGGRRPGGCV